MRKTSQRTKALDPPQLPKCPTGIKGFDEITHGGLPKHRITLICGNTGCGKTLLGIDFLNQWGHSFQRARHFHVL